MSELATLARPYAAAAFKRAKETSATDKWSLSLAFLASVIKYENISHRKTIKIFKIKSYFRVR